MTVFEFVFGFISIITSLALPPAPRAPAGRAGLPLVV